MVKIHFICRGNVLRSLVAETYVRSLHIEGIECMSSGVSVDIEDETERGYFANTLALLARHNISHCAKPLSDQLTQIRVDVADMTVCVNQRAFNEAAAIVALPPDTIIWDIVDIGEGARAINKDVPNTRIQYEEEIYNEIIVKINELILDMRSINTPAKG